MPLPNYLLEDPPLVPLDEAEARRRRGLPPEPPIAPASPLPEPTGELRRIIAPRRIDDIVTNPRLTDYEKAMAVEANVKSERPQQESPKWWQRVAAGAAGGLAGLVNAGGRTHVDPTAAVEGIYGVPEQRRKLSDWLGRVEGAEAKTAAAKGTLEAWRQGETQDRLDRLADAQTEHLRSQAEKDLAEAGKPKMQIVPAGSSVVGHDGKVIFTAPSTNSGRTVVPAGSTVIGADGKPVFTAPGAAHAKSADQQVFDAAIRGIAAKRGIKLDDSKPLMEQLPVDAQSEAALEHKRLNTLPPSELDQALKRALLVQRNAQNTTTPAVINPGTREYRIAQDLAYGKLTMQQFRSLSAYSRDTNKKMDIYDKASELNPNFNPAAFEMGYALAKNPKVQQQLASMDNVKSGMSDLLKFSDQASRSGVTVLNKLIVPGGVAIGDKKYSNFHTAQIAFADELSGALGFGSATDMSRQMGVDMTNPNLSPEAFRSAVEEVVGPFVERKRKSLLDQMGIYGQSGMQPQGGSAAPVTPPPAQGGTIRFAEGGKTYNIPAAAEAEFLKDHPGAKRQ